MSPRCCALSGVPNTYDDVDSHVVAILARQLVSSSRADGGVCSLDLGGFVVVVSITDGDMELRLTCFAQALDMVNFNYKLCGGAVAYLFQVLGRTAGIFADIAERLWDATSCSEGGRQV